MARSNIYEVRCERCQTSFAPETRRCVHCGGPLGRGRLIAAVSAVRPSDGSQPVDPAPPLAIDQEPEEAEDALAALRAGRSPLWIVTAVLIMAASMLRTCLGG